MDNIELDIKKWLKYFSNKGILIGTEESKCLLKDIKKGFKEHGKDDYLLNYRMNSLKSLLMSSQDFLDSNSLDLKTFLRGVNKESVHITPDYSLTDTYRLITKNPCIGNLDSELKRVIVPRDGYNIVSIDYKNQEPWIIVNLLMNDELLDLIENNDDFYYGLLVKFKVEITVENRELVKKVWNSSIYGSSLNTVCSENVDWIKDIYDWINNLKEVKSLRNKVGNNIKNNKPIYTLFGLNRHMSYSGTKSLRQAFNSIFQMTGSGVLYAGLKTINNASLFKENDLNIYFTNHDEYILESSVFNTREDINDLISQIDFSIDGWTYPKFEIKMGKNWGDCV